jgi:hypothetical protein
VTSLLLLLLPLLGRRDVAGEMRQAGQLVVRMVQMVRHSGKEEARGGRQGSRAAASAAAVLPTSGRGM